MAGQQGTLSLGFSDPKGGHKISFNVVIQETGQVVENQTYWTTYTNPHSNDETVLFTPAQNGPLTMVLTVVAFES
jgi:hypothetical protein